MKSMRPPLGAIFFMTYFHRAGGGACPPRPPRSATASWSVTLAIVIRCYLHVLALIACFKHPVVTANPFESGLVRPYNTGDRSLLTQWMYVMLIECDLNAQQL